MTKHIIMNNIVDELKSMKDQLNYYNRLAKQKTQELEQLYNNMKDNNESNTYKVDNMFDKYKKIPNNMHNKTT